MRPIKNLLSWFGIFTIFFHIGFTQKVFSQTADFNVQHIEDDIGNNGGSNTTFNPVNSLDKAFVLANNNRKTHAGNNGSGSNLEGDDMSGARQLTSINTLTYFRETNSRTNDMRFNSSIWEYIGPDGGNNEFRVRGRFVINLNGTTNSITHALTGVVDANKSIPFITGITNNSANNDADSGTAIAYLENATTLRVQKGSNNHNVSVYITLVEFTGCNWTVLHGDSGNTAGDNGTITLYDGSDATGTATDVSAWNEAMIFSHFRADNNANGQNQAISDLWPLLAPGANNQSINWTFNNGHDSNGTNRHFTHVLINSGLNITRYQDTQRDANENTVNITSAGLTSIDEAIIIGNSISSGNGTAYGRGWRNYYINSTTEAAHWTHRNGNTMSHEIQIADLSGLQTLTPEITITELPPTLLECGDMNLDVNANLTNIPFTNNTYQWSYTIVSGTSTAPVTFTPTNTASTSIYFPENVGEVVYRVTLTFTSTPDCGNPVIETYESLVTIHETTATNAGTDQIITNINCGTNAVALSATNTSGHTGTWSIIAGIGGSFDDENNQNATFTGNTNETYTLRWSIPCSEDDVTIALPENCTDISFDGTNNYINLGDAYNASGAFTHEIWINPTTLIGSQIIYSKRSTDNLINGYDLRLTNTTLSFNWNNGNSINSPYPLIANKWYQTVVSFDGTTYRLYIDGIEVNNQTGNVPVTNTVDYLVGAINQSSNPFSNPPINHFNGLLDELRIWNTALSVNQIRNMMNQEIEANITSVHGSVINDTISGLNWNSDLSGYFQFNLETDVENGNILDKSINLNNGKIRNSSEGSQPESCPLPYTTIIDGEWSDTTASSPWTYGDSVWNAPNSLGIDRTTYIDWNIIQTDHNITIDTSADLGRERSVLGLIVNTNELQINGNTAAGTGNGLTVSHYLKIDGVLDLEGESQLIQLENSILDVASSGTLERDQQGTADLYTYNYWAAPVGVTSVISNNNDYSLSDVLNDGTTAVSPQTINWITSGYDGTSGSPVGIADYWIWKYANQVSDNYPSWQHVRSNGTLQPGEGYTMKGTTDTGGAISSEQNYVFNGKPHNGDITLTLSAGNDYLVGNPYASAIDANEFILDNVSDSAGRAASNIIDGTLYFWEHFASSTHILSEYQGGYGTYTLLGGVIAISNDVRINNTGASGTKIPEQFIPVGQGFFVTADTGGTITFKNSQRTFKTEASDPSTFMRVNHESKKDTKDKNNNTVSRNGNTDIRQKIRLMFDSPKGYHRQLLVGVDSSATDNHDIGYDAPLIEDNVEDMYWSFDNNKFVIQGVNDFNTDRILSLGVKVEQQGNATIRIDFLENIPLDTNIYLHDKELQTYHNLRESNYETFLTTGEHNNRFEITFANGEALSNPTKEFSKLDIHYSNKIESIVLFNPTNDTINNIKMTNILGQIVFEYTYSIRDTYRELMIKGLNSGAYFITIDTIKGKVTKKVIVQ